MYARNDEVALPVTGQLKNGTWVSNYHLLPEKTLLEEDWKPLIEEKPVFDPETHCLILDKTEDTGKAIKAIYKAVEIPPDELRTVTAERDMLLAEKQAFAKAYQPTLLKSQLTALCDGYIKAEKPIGIVRK